MNSRLTYSGNRLPGVDGDVPWRGEFMVIEAGDTASVCLNLTEELVLTASRDPAKVRGDQGDE